MLCLCSLFFKEVGANTILQDIARARENIQKSLAGVSLASLKQKGFYWMWLKSLC